MRLAWIETNVDAKVNREPGAATLEHRARAQCNGIRVKGVNGKGIKIKDLDRRK